MADDSAPGSFPPGGPTPPLATGLVYLRAAERTDLPLFVRWLNDLRTTRSLLIFSPMSEVLEERWFDHMIEHQGKDLWHFVVCRRADDRPVGVLDLHDVDVRNGGASLGILIGDPADTGQGYGSDALRALVGFGFDQLRLERIQLDVFDTNEGARRLYERVGFRNEGTLRQAVYRDGVFHDVHRMAILRDEWSGRPPA